MDVQTSLARLTDVLRENHVSYELVPHRRTVTAVAEGRAVGVDAAHVAKTLVLTTDEGFVRVVLPASERIDLRKVRAELACDEIALATEEALVGAYPEFELGAVPPIGGPRSDLVLVDGRVHDAGTVVFEAGTHEHSVRMKAGDLVRVAGARVVDICEE